MRGDHAHRGARTAAITNLRRLAGGLGLGLGLVVSAALAGCGSSSSQEPPATPGTVAMSAQDAALKSAAKPESPESAAAPTPSAPPEGGATSRSAPGEEASEPNEDDPDTLTRMKGSLISERAKSRRVAECNQLIKVMNEEGAKLSPKGSATDPSTMTQMAEDLDAAGRAIEKVKLSIPEVVSFRDRSASLFRDVARAARSSGAALQAKDLKAATKSLKELTDSAQANTALVLEINEYCQE